MGFEVGGASDWTWHEEEPSWSQNPKPSCQGLVLAKRNVGAFILDKGDPIWVEYTVFEVVGASN